MTLRAVFERANYTAEGVLSRIGESGQSGLERNVTVPAAQALGDARDEQATLIKLFLLQQAVPAADVAFLDAYPELLIAGDNGLVRAAIDLRPYGSADDGASGWLASDLVPGLDHSNQPTKPDFVLGASPASTTLAQLVMRSPVNRVLDLGTGCGVQALHLAKHSRQVVATDINPRAIELAQKSAELSGSLVEFRLGSLFEPVAGEVFDLIVSNPPYVMSPPAANGDTLVYRETGFEGDALLRNLIADARKYLAPGGSMQLLTNWAIVAQENWQDRLRDWLIPTGLDAWVIERERLDKYSYIEMWLADAGLADSEQWRPAYEQWLSYFDELGITAVGLGWILLTAAERKEPHIRIESWPHAVQQPVAEAFTRHAAAVTAASLSDEKLWASRPVLADVRQETMGEAGAQDPEYIIFRQTTGLLRAMRVDTALAAVLGALDGELTLGQVITAVAQLLDRDLTELTAELLPKVRAALEEQYLLLAGPA